MRTSFFPVLLGCLLVAGACSDDPSSPQNKDMAARDQSQPVKDGLVDAPQDIAVDQQTLADKGKVQDSDQDVAAADLVSDQGGPDGPPPILSGTISRSVDPIFDARGTIYVGVMNALFDPPTKIQGADLSQPGSTVRYAIYGVAPGDYELWAFLDDNGNAGIFPFADPGDLITSAVIPITVGATPLVKDIVLNQVQGVAADAGVGDGNVAMGSLRGRISRNVVPTLDAGGVLYISLHGQLPPADQVALTSVAAVDLSSPYASETYFMGSLAPGKYYLQVFLDDNENAFFLQPEPDKDDLTHSQPIQVHVVAGVVNEQDVVLDQVVP